MAGLFSSPKPAPAPEIVYLPAPTAAVPSSSDNSTNNNNSNSSSNSNSQVEELARQIAASAAAAQAVRVEEPVVPAAPAGPAVGGDAGTGTTPPQTTPQADEDPVAAREAAVAKRARGRAGTVATSWRGLLTPGALTANALVPARKTLLGE